MSAKIFLYLHIYSLKQLGGKICELRLEDRGSNELFAACPVENYPGLAIEAVTDSSRYFVICILDKESGRKVCKINKKVSTKFIGGA